MLCPLFGAVNHLPFDLTLHSTSYNQVPPSPSRVDHPGIIDHEKNGQLHKPTVLSGQGVFTQLPHFYADIWHQLQLYHGEDDIAMEPMVSVSSTMLHELPVANLSYEQLASFSQQWPYHNITTPPELVTVNECIVCLLGCLSVCVHEHVFCVYVVCVCVRVCACVCVCVCVHWHVPVHVHVFI